MKYLLYFLISMAILSSCNKKLEVDTPALNISLDPSRLVADTFTYKLGDTTLFTFTGYADNIAWYPGIPGFSYDNKDRTQGPFGVANMQFTSYRQYGAQNNTLKILATTTLAGLDSASVVNGAWTDITSRATLSTGTDNTASGVINLSDITVQGKPLYIAFRYNGVTGSTQRTWTFKNWFIRSVTPEGTIVVTDLTSAGWTVYGVAGRKWTTSTTQIQIAGGDGAAPTNEGWIVTKPLDITSVPPDVSIPIKATGSGAMSSYAYKYAAAGTYKAVFKISNNTIKEEKTILKEFWIKIIP